MEQFINDIYTLLIEFIKNYLLYIIIISFILLYWLSYKFTNRSKAKLDSDVLNMEDSLICLHDDNSKRIAKLERQIKTLESAVHDRELEIKKLEKEVDSLK